MIGTQAKVPIMAQRNAFQKQKLHFTQWYIIYAELHTKPLAFRNLIALSFDKYKLWLDI